MKKLTLAIASAIMLATAAVSASNPASEVRAVWLTTNAGLDWPTSSYTEASQKSKLTALLDKLQQANFNTIVFQVQVKGDVAWKSAKQPAMYSLTGNGSKGLSYDVCGYVIGECHKRGMECHAWIVPYRIGTENEARRYDSNAVKHPSRTHSDLLITYSNAYYLDPGNPATTEYLVDLYRELVTNYDFDGINFDYTRYPGSDFADDTSFGKYNPNNLSKADWRRNNINDFIKKMYEMVKSVKPLMRVGAAPIGTYKNVAGYGNMTAYGSVYQDAAYWMSSGNHDLLIPQMYWNERYGFTPNMQTWVDNCGGRQLVIGLAPYKMVDGSNNWEYTVVTDQIEKQRANPGTSGVCFFRTEHVTGSATKVVQLYNALKNNYFSTPAKIPAMDYLTKTTPNPPANVALVDGKLTWSEPPLDAMGTPIKGYAVYRKQNGRTDVSNAESIVAIVREPACAIPAGEPAGAEYSVTTLDRNNFESAPADPSGVGTMAAATVSPVVTLRDKTVDIVSPAPIHNVTVCNVSGQTVAQADGGGSVCFSMSLDGIQGGIYILRLSTADGMSAQKIII